MIRSMYAAISGLRNHQTMMDVVGNNIANVNTNGYKGSSTVFTDVLSQTLTGGNAPGAMGGTNPAQVGLGSRLGGINTDFSQGSLQRSGRNTDFAIQGDGFFVTNSGGEQLYTRAGSFNLDADGNIVTNDGGFLQGWVADATGAVNTNAPVAGLQIPTGALIPPRGTTNVDMTGNLPGGAAPGTVVTTAINVFDTQGNAIPLNLSYTRTTTSTNPNNEWTVTATYGNPATNVPLTGGVLTFDANGQLEVPPTLGIAAGAIPQVGAMTIDLGQPTDPNHVTQFGTGASVLARTQDGYAPGTLQSFTLGRDGTIVGSYSNGQTRAIAQVAMATFANPQGLSKIGSSQFRIGANSGAAEIGPAGTGGRGILTQGALEQSNVDLAQEFTSLIVAQRGFQANSRVITTSDEMLQEVVNLKR
jgi:flagellar hook protein FlgE